MTEENEHFRQVDDWEQAEEMLGFEPLRPRHEPRAFRIHVKDHRLRDVAPTLEVDFDGYFLSQAKRDQVEAMRLAELRYGPDPNEISVVGRPGIMYELGPEPEPDDIDPRPPAIVTWADGDLFLLLASETRPASDLLQIAASLYPAR